MLTVQELWELIDREVTALPAERVLLEEACGRLLREEVRADSDLPAFDRSAIDGYCVRAEAKPGEFALVGEVKPGSPAGPVPEAGQAVKIFTGSALPESGVGLVMVEDAEVVAGGVILRVPPDCGLIRRRASQQRAGEVVLSAGSLVTPGAVALLATVGVVKPWVSAQPRFAHLSTGSELVPAGEQPGPGSIRDSNSPLIAALTIEAGARLVWHGRSSESIDTAVGQLRDFDADALLISGGASVGEHDGTEEILRKLGYVIHSTKVRSRPGKPLIFATRGRRVAFGLPGNPLSHFVCFHVFVRRALDRLAGVPCRELIEVACADLPPSDPRETWWPVRVVTEAGELRADPLPWTDSSDLTGLPTANGLLRVGGERISGRAQVLLFGRLA